MFSFDILQVVSAQSLNVFSPELLENFSISSDDRFQYLKTKIPLPPNPLKNRES